MITNPHLLPTLRTKIGALHYLVRKHHITRLIPKVSLHQNNSTFLRAAKHSEIHSECLPIASIQGDKSISKQTSALFFYNQSDPPVWRRDSEHRLFQELTAFKSISDPHSSVLVIDRVNGADRPATSSIASWLAENYPTHTLGIRFDMLICAPESPLSQSPEAWAQNAPDFEPEPYVEMPEGLSLLPTEFFDERTAIQEGFSRFQCISCVAITSIGNSFETLQALCNSIHYARRHQLRRIYTQTISWLRMGDFVLSDGLIIVNRSGVLFNDEEVILAGPHTSWQPATLSNSASCLKIARELHPFLVRKSRQGEPAVDLSIHLGPSPNEGQYVEPATRSDRAHLDFYHRVFDLKSWGNVEFVSRSRNHRAVPEIEAVNPNLQFKTPRIATEAEEIDLLLHSKTIVISPSTLENSLSVIHLSKILETVIAPDGLSIGPIPEGIQILHI